MFHEMVPIKEGGLPLEIDWKGIIQHRTDFPCQTLGQIKVESSIGTKAEERNSSVCECERKGFERICGT